MTVETIIKEGKGTIIDVRTIDEYRSGHAVNSVNIPLQEIRQRAEEIKALEQPLILCCASGNRSGQAVQALSQEGLDCYNGGSWMNVNYLQTQNS